MKTCIATVSIPGSFREKISAISGAGFDAIELFEPDLTAHGGKAREAGMLIRDHGLEMTILQPFIVILKDVLTSVVQTLSPRRSISST